MTQRGPFLFLVALLLLAGVGIATFRQQEYRIPLLPGAQQTVWEVEARIIFQARGQATQAYLTLPPNQDGFRVVSETGASSGFGFEVEAQRAQRRAHWTKRNARGEQILFYKLQLVQDPSYRVESIPPTAIATVRWDEPYRTAAQQILQSAMPISADARTLTQQLINSMNLVPADQNISLLRDRYDEP
ncbi:MAG: UUP1 family membrane protein, partial [Gammaproteobacteria bacterium]|nr:UUP1 family membrane protein [Gammaproteobacteria bacterium]